MLGLTYVNIKRENAMDLFAIFQLVNNTACLDANYVTFCSLYPYYGYWQP